MCQLKKSHFGVVGGNVVVELHILRHLLKQSGADAAHEVKQHETALAEHLLYHAAEHPQREHVEQQMCQSAVHEHVREELVHLEVGRKEEVEAEMGIHPRTHNQRQQIAYDVGNEQIFRYRRDI